jgi:hypothetical protein
VQASVLVALKQLIRGENDEAKKNGQAEADNKGNLFELGALSTAIQAGDCSQTPGGRWR